MDRDELAQLLEESVEELYERAPVAHMSTLPSGAFVKVNQTLLDWTGYARDDMLGGLRLFDLLAPGARIYWETHYAPLLQMQGEVREIAVELLRIDGTRLPVLMNSTAVSDDAGRVRIVRTTCIDATERRRYERELLRARADAELRARSALALGHVTEGVVLIDAQGRVELMNRVAEEIFGLASADVAGRAASEALPGWAAVAAAAEQGARTVAPVGDGWLEVAAVDAGDGDVYTIRDVTGDRRLEQLRADLVAIVSHELRTPLTGAYGAAATLLARSDLPEERRRALLEMVVDQTRRMATIVDQILAASRIDSGNLGADIGVFEASAVLDGVARAVPEEKLSRLIVESNGDLPVRADLDRLRQVIGNLVDNALKYSAGPVRLSMEERGAVVRYFVGDEGPGIPKAEHERIFEKFYRLDPHQAAGVSGTGLGLYIARELVERMGGSLGLLPQERGTTFFVDVPRADA